MDVNNGNVAKEFYEGLRGLNRKAGGSEWFFLSGVTNFVKTP